MEKMTLNIPNSKYSIEFEKENLEEVIDLLETLSS